MADRATDGRRDRTRFRRPSRTGVLVLAVVATVLAAVAAAAILRAAVADLYRIPSGSMEPTLLPGDRIAVDRDAYAAEPVQRGEIIVVDGEGSFTPYDDRPAVLRRGEDALQWLGLAPDRTAVVKRVAGIGGDTVACCDDDGRLVLNGEPVTEDYLAEPPPASAVEFTATVPAGRLFLLGDNRHASTDSRALLGAPGGGMIPEQDVIGRVSALAWPPERRAELPAR